MMRIPRWVWSPLVLLPLGLLWGVLIVLAVTETMAWQLIVIGSLGGIFALMFVALFWYRRERNAYRERYLLEQKMQQERAEMVARLQEKNEELETLLYAATHDLRVPLVTIQGFTERSRKAVAELQRIVTLPYRAEELCRLARPLIEEELPRNFARIASSSERMDVLVKALLRIARLDRSAPRGERLAMNALMKRVCDGLAFHLQEADAEVQIGDLPDCWGDPGEIEQLFTNLVDNAVKYRDPVRKLVIRITGSTLKERAIYAVSDTGIGIKKEHQGQIWLLFSRLNPRGPTVGDGIGLALVQRIAKRHGGAVWLTSEPGQGSTFSVALPTRPRDATARTSLFSEGETP